MSTNNNQARQIDAAEVENWLTNLESQLRALLDGELDDTCMIGIRTGGVSIAEKLHEQFGMATPLGQLNISFYRDDFSHIGMHPVVGASDIPFDIEGRTVILVDDVLHSGRTIRAAMNEIFDFGRPSRIVLAVLTQRHGRQLPIQADALGKELDLHEDEHIKLNCDTMTCSITRVSPRK